MHIPSVAPIGVKHVVKWNWKGSVLISADHQIELTLKARYGKAVYPFLYFDNFIDYSYSYKFVFSGTPFEKNWIILDPVVFAYLT